MKAATESCVVVVVTAANSSGIGEGKPKAAPQQALHSCFSSLFLAMLCLSPSSHRIHTERPHMHAAVSSFAALAARCPPSPSCLFPSPQQQTHLHAAVALLQRCSLGRQQLLTRHHVVDADAATRQHCKTNTHKSAEPPPKVRGVSCAGCRAVSVRACEFHTRHHLQTHTHT